MERGFVLDTGDKLAHRAWVGRKEEPTFQGSNNRRQGRNVRVSPSRVVFICDGTIRSRKAKTESLLFIQALCGVIE